LKRTFVDAGVLIAAVRGQEELARRALKVLSDPEREFIGSPFLRLEVLPKAIHHRRLSEVRFYREFFETVRHWPLDVESVVAEAFTVGVELGLSALDALHVAVAANLGCEELITTEQPNKPIYRSRSVKVVYLMAS